MKKIVFILSAATLLSACGQSSGEHKDDALDVAEAEQSSKTFIIDADASSIEWFGEKVTGWSHTGTLRLLKGNLNVLGDELQAGNFVADMSSMGEINSVMPEEKQAKLMGHLRSPDFFDVEQYPTSSFAISEVSTDSIRGNLTIKGISHAIAMPYTLSVEGEELKANATFTFDRSRWDIRYGSGSFFEDLGDELIKDEIDMKVTLVAHAHVN